MPITSLPRSRFRANAPGAAMSPFGDRARRFAWPARGTERFLGRSLSTTPQEELTGRRRRAATRDGPIPYSCLAPPRPRRQADDRTTNHPGADAEDFQACEKESIARRIT